MWSVIAPIVNFNPIKSSARVPGDKVPDKLPAFCRSPVAGRMGVSFHQIEVVNGIPDREAARRAFTAQLGPRWSGINDCPPHVQALFAAYALKGSQRREESDELLGRLSLCWTPKGGFKMTSEIASEVKKLIRDPEVGGKALEIDRSTCLSHNRPARSSKMGALDGWRFSAGAILVGAWCRP